MPARQPDAASMLAFTDLFGGLTEKSRVMLAGIAVPKRLRKKQVLFQEGEKGFAVYLLGSGSIRLSKHGEEGSDVVIKVVPPGEVFGEVVLFEQPCYPVTATALQPSTVFILPKHQFHCLLENRGFRDEFIVLLMAKQRYLTERLRTMQTQDVEKRFLLFLKEHYGESERIVPGISKKEMAAAIGTVPETFSRLLLRLKKAGRLRWEGGEIRVSRNAWA